MSKYNWKKLAQPTPRGHRFFEDKNTGRIAIADNSGPTPDRTDDGVLWLDSSRKMLVKLEHNCVRLTMPVTTPRDSSWSVGITIAEAHWLLREGHWPKRQVFVGKRLPPLWEFFNELGMERWARMLERPEMYDEE